ncbi:MAG: hypothetical protein WCI62_00925 [Erysipelotrichaceae bacterium]
MNSIIGLISAFIYIFVIILISTRLVKYPYESSRIFVHIMAANAWFIGIFLIKDYWFAFSIPVFFIIFTTLNIIFDWVPALNSKIRYKSLGNIYYVCSVALLTLLTFNLNRFQIAGGLGIMVMAYGDGFASLIGQRFGSHTYTIFKGKKSLEGSLTMFVVSVLAIIAYLAIVQFSLNWYVIIVIAAVATVVEGISPYGLDNIFVPLIVALLYTVYLF